MKEWKLVFSILWINVLSFNLKTQISYPLNLILPRHLKQGVQEFHRKYGLVPADKAANTLKQELNGTKAYE